MSRLSVPRPALHGLSLTTVTNPDVGNDAPLVFGGDRGQVWKAKWPSGQQAAWTGRLQRTFAGCCCCVAGNRRQLTGPFVHLQATRLLWKWGNGRRLRRFDRSVLRAPPDLCRNVVGQSSLEPPCSPCNLTSRVLLTSIRRSTPLALGACPENRSLTDL